MRCKTVKGVLANFLETYTSRYSAFRGYWIFGMIVAHLDQFSVDLLEGDSVAGAASPLSVASQLAITKFREQIEKAGLGLCCIQEARLEVRRSQDYTAGSVNGHPSAGFVVDFVVRVTIQSGRTYESKKSKFIAPHDPVVEFKSWVE